MNYILYSIILLVVIIIIIYILSIDNNIDKFKNKVIELFKVAKSKKINYLNSKDNINILNYIKQQFMAYDNITIPNKIYYSMINNNIIMNNILIECYNMKTLEQNKYNINIIFIPFEKDNKISYHSILGLYGNYKLEINNDTPIPIPIPIPIPTTTSISKPKPKSIKVPTKPLYTIDEADTYTDIFDKIPDIIHLTEDNSENITTDSYNINFS